jgi:hypothetical protein
VRVAHPPVYLAVSSQQYSATGLQHPWSWRRSPTSPGSDDLRGVGTLPGAALDGVIINNEYEQLLPCAFVRVRR